MFQKYITFLKNLGIQLHISDHVSSVIAQCVTGITLFIVAAILFWLTKFLLNKTIVYAIKRSSNQYDDAFVNSKLFSRISVLVPLYIIKYSIALALPEMPVLSGFILLLCRIAEVIAFTSIFNSVIAAAYEIYASFDVSKSKPIKGLLQVIKIIATIVCTLLIVTILTQRDLHNIIIGLGTLSAVLMLVFKDPILGFVGGIQLMINDMVRIDDWIVMPENNADGNVVDIGLITVKVQNWDNTITTIPTYSMISNSFTNWRGMSESGGRRISRAITIDVETVKFCTPEMLERYSKFQLVSQYIKDTEAEVQEYNKTHNIDDSSLVNGRRQTNLGVFRAYLKAYLLSNPKLNQKLTIMVRQLPPDEKGIPLQIYAFSANKEWVAYEDIQSDIFDHILAVVPMFDLKIYQKPSSNSIAAISQEIKH